MIDLKACPLWLYRLLPFLRWWPNVRRRRSGRQHRRAHRRQIVLPQAVAFSTIAGCHPSMVSTQPWCLPSSLHCGIELAPGVGATTAISIVVFASISPLAESGSPQFIGLVLTLTLLAA